jgi:dihydroflavonol-4-reductase
MTTLVTGAAGHLGLTLVQQLLERGETVRALDLRPSEALRALPVEIIEADLTGPAALAAAFEGVGRVFHAATYISLRMDEWPRVEAVNVEGVRQIVRQCLAHHVGRLVHFSSIEALNMETGAVVTEDTPLVGPDFPVPYPRSKAMGQRIVTEAIRQGLNAVIVYPTGILGPNDYKLHASNQVPLRLRKGEPLAFADGGLDWVDVRDVAAGAIAASECAPAGSSYLLGNRYATLREIAAIIRELAHEPPPGRQIALRQVERLLPLIEGYARVTRQPPMVTRTMIYPLKHGGQVSHERAARELGYRPRPLEDTLADTLVWFDQLHADAPVAR